MNSLLLRVVAVWLCCTWGLSLPQSNPGADVKSALGKLERDFSVLDARLCWYRTYLGGDFPFPDSAFVLPCPLIESTGVKHDLLNNPSNIEESNYAEYNERLRQMLERRDRLIDSFRTVFSFRWEVETSGTQAALIREFCTDPFGDGAPYEYFSFFTSYANQACLLRSNGPDRQKDFRIENLRILGETVDYNGVLPDCFYDPTNGLLSSGDIIHVIAFDYRIPQLPDIRDPRFQERVRERRRLAVEDRSVEDLKKAIGVLPLGTDERKP